MTDELKPCPFCGKVPVRVSIGTASCDGMVDGREVHNTIGMRPECWNTRSTSLSDEALVERLREALSDLMRAVERDGEIGGLTTVAMLRAHKTLAAIEAIASSDTTLITEPTSEMIEAGMGAWLDHRGFDDKRCLAAIWKAMLGASNQPGERG